MARRLPRTRSALRLVVGLPIILLAGCTGGPPQACGLALLEPSVSVDVGALGVAPATVEALLCVEDDCGARGPWFDADPSEQLVSRAGVDVPDQDEVEVRAVLTDPGTGAEVYRGSGTIPTEVVEPNGPGCGTTRILPTVTADPDGTLRG